MSIKLICYISIAACFSLSVEGQVLFGYGENTPEIIKDSETVTKDWEHLEKVLRDGVNAAFKMLMPLLMDGTQSLNISSHCMRDSLLIIAGIRKLKTWAVRFLDSTAKGMDGMITGTARNYGAYDECLDTIAINERSGKNKGKVMFTGKYCLLRLKMHLPPLRPDIKEGVVIKELTGVYKRETILSEVVKYAFLFYVASGRLGLCIPSGCTVDDINQIVKKAADYLHIYAYVKDCEVKEEPKYTPMMIFVMSAFSFVGFLLLLGSVVDIYYFYYQKKPSRTSIRILLAFSFISNFRKLTDTSSSSENLSCLNGIRFITMSWVIIVHLGVVILGQAANGMIYVQELMQTDFAVQVLLNPSVSVETFFFLGGFLVCYVATKHVVIGKKNFSIIFYVLHRLWRLLPVLIFAILFVFIMEILPSGPAARESIKPFVDGCRDNWWALLLFISNIHNPQAACLPHTWYLSVDMQLYIGSLIILLPLFRWSKFGITIALIILVGSMFGSAIVTWIMNFPPILLLVNTNLDAVENYVLKYHFLPYPHIAPYIVGLLAGRFLAMHPDLKIPKRIQILGWCCAVTTSLLVVYGGFWWQKGIEPAVWETVFYAGCFRVVWALCIAWMIICCATGHGGIVNYILSWKLWIPVGRLTYTAYVTHVLVVVCFGATLRNPIFPKYTTFVWLFFGAMMMTYGIAFASSMLIESPFMALEKLLLPQRDEDSPEKSEKRENPPMGIAEIVKEKDMQNLNPNLNHLESKVGTDNAAFVCRL